MKFVAERHAKKQVDFDFIFCCSRRSSEQGNKKDANSAEEALWACTKKKKIKGTTRKRRLKIFFNRKFEQRNNEVCLPLFTYLGAYFILSIIINFTPFIKIPDIKIPVLRGLLASVSRDWKLEITHQLWLPPL